VALSIRTVSRLQPSDRLRSLKKNEPLRIEAIFGTLWVVIAREMTKLHEEFLRGSPRQLLDRFAAKPPRGEMVVLFNSRVRCETQKNTTPAEG